MSDQLTVLSRTTLFEYKNDSNDSGRTDSNDSGRTDSNRSEYYMGHSDWRAPNTDKEIGIGFREPFRSLLDANGIN